MVLYIDEVKVRKIKGYVKLTQSVIMKLDKGTVHRRRKG